jgi:hypothetical protein
LFLLPTPKDNAAMETEPPKVEPTKRKRRRYQFSLRSLLIAFTVLAIPCAYVGWQESIIRERRAVVATHGTLMSWEIPRLKDIAPWQPSFRPRPPFPLRWFGEDGFAVVYAKDSETDDEIDNLKRLFPEAQIRRGGQQLR